MASWSRSSARNQDRPLDRTRNGSGPWTSVQLAGSERTRVCPGSRKKTRCSPQVWANPTSSNSHPFSGWNGCVTRNRCGSLPMPAVDGVRRGQGGGAGALGEERPGARGGLRFGGGGERGRRGLVPGGQRRAAPREPGGTSCAAGAGASDAAGAGGASGGGDGRESEGGPPEHGSLRLGALLGAEPAAGRGGPRAGRWR